MPALSLKNIPDKLYLQLKEAAKAHHRSLNSEIIYCIERVLGTHEIDVSDHIATARMLRAKTASNFITEDELSSIKSKDRP